MAGRVHRDDFRSRFLHRCLDVGLIWLALTLAYLLKEGLALGEPTQPISPPVVIHTFASVALIWLLTASALETYAYKRRLLPEIANLVAVLAVSMAFFLTYVYFTRLFDMPRYVMILYPSIGAVLLAVSRALKQSIQRMLHRRHIGTRRVVIIGDGQVARRLAAAFTQNHALGYEFRGFIVNGCGTAAPVGEAASDGPLTVNGRARRAERRHVASRTPDARDAEQLGTLDDLERIIEDQDVDEIIVALPGHQHDEVLSIAHRCQAREVRLRVVPDLFEVTMVRATLTEIDDIPLIGLRDPVLTGYQSFVKRCFDIVMALFCLALAAPLFIIVPVLIRLDSRGRVFFSQIRVGENGRPFRMYKFRSMVDDAEARLRDLVRIEDLAEPMYKLKDDPRVTRLGRFLRRTSLDEVPQLINVLKGDMSMVGPRPEELQVVQHYQLWHRKRLSVKPGLTGPMQVAGRGELPLDERIRLELMYISHYSVFEDLKYLLKTIPAVCRARGAY